MAGYNTSSAYDLSQFEAVSKKELSTAELKVIKNRKPKPSSVLGPGVLCAFLIVIGLVVLMVYNHVQLAELTSEMNSLQKEMEVLESENVKLTSVLESEIKIETIREQALAMGMQKRDEYQTERIYLYQDDKIERTESSPEQTVDETAKLAITSFFSRFKEYIAER